ncbi:restriction endonuclease [Rhodovibrio salinarum]|nr:restriction endonuclease [Rhodovibrio salinarum]
MKDCILSVLWAKKDIYQFFYDAGCSNDELSVIEEFKKPEMARGKMVDLIFDQLLKRQDSGLGQYRAMLKSLLDWSHFDEYYFDKINKLDRNVANRNLEHLRQLVEIRDQKHRDNVKRRTSGPSDKLSRYNSLEELRSIFIELHEGKIKAQQRGYEFEKFLKRLAELENLQVTGSFRNKGEQIDGALKYDGENYIIEAKWQEKRASTEPLYAFASKVEGKMYGRGLFVSVAGFSPEPVKMLISGKAMKTILMDGEDIQLILEDQITLSKVLEKKIASAQIKGHIYVHPITEQPKV